MTLPSDGSTRITAPADTAASGTRTGAEVTGRMTGTSGTGRDHDTMDHRPVPRPGTDTDKSPKTSAAAVFALVFGLAALFCALTGILAPAAFVFGLIGVVLGVLGRTMGQRPGVTGKGVATGGLVTALLGMLLGGAVIVGLAAVVNNESNLNRISDFVDSARENLPSGQQIESDVKESVQ